jgi:alkaline phosphatase
MNYSRRHLLQGSLAAGGSLAAFGDQHLAEELERKLRGRRPLGIVFCVSDGMSQGVLSMSEAFSQQVRSQGTVWWNLMSSQKAVMGLMDTASSSSLVTDSAAASSAWSGGQRIPNGKINVDEQGREIQSLGETLEKSHVRLGLVSSATITHATPAAFAATVPNRGQEESIAEQYLKRVDVLLGGGSRFFDPKVRKDHQNLFEIFEKQNYQVIRTRNELLHSKSEKLLGTFSPGYLPYELDRKHDEELMKKIPSLAEMTEAALSRFLSSGDPFLMQMEGARIDHAAHQNDIGAILHEQLAFDDAVAKVLTLTAHREDILVILTSDHGNANPGLNGTGSSYRETNRSFSKVAEITRSTENFLSQCQQELRHSKLDLAEFFTSTYGFAPSANELDALMERLSGREVVEWSQQHKNSVGLLGQIVGNVTGVGWTGICHTADPTQLTSTGPGANQFAGLIRNDSVRDRLLRLLPI